jgi:hypothetical protein
LYIIFVNFIYYKFKSKKLKAISSPPKITIIKLKPKIQFKFNIILLKINKKKMTIIINSDVSSVVIKLFEYTLNDNVVKKNNVKKNFNQNNNLLIKGNTLLVILNSNHVLVILRNIVFL